MKINFEIRFQNCNISFVRFSQNVSIKKTCGFYVSKLQENEIKVCIPLFFGLYFFRFSISRRLAIWNSLAVTSQVDSKIIEYC